MLSQLMVVDDYEKEIKDFKERSNQDSRFSDEWEQRLYWLCWDRSGREESFDGEEFKNFFNLRAPANIVIVGPLFNIEKK